MITVFRRNNRKGLSPLIATVLLIAFAIALGTVIMNWSIQQAESSPIYEVCTDESDALKLTFNNPGMDEIKGTLSIGGQVVGNFTAEGKQESSDYDFSAYDPKKHSGEVVITIRGSRSVGECGNQ